MHISMVILLIVFQGLAPAKGAAKQTSGADEMKKLAFMIGDWNGNGWIIRGPGKRQTFSQKEKIQYKVNGQVLQIDGLGTTRDPETGNEVVVHDAFGIVTFDQASGVHRIRAYSPIRGEVDSDFKLENRSIVWGFDEPRAGGKIRFTLTFDENGHWVEKGEMTRDGKNWMQFFEMNLERAGTK